jgi:hypothetical protein
MPPSATHALPVSPAASALSDPVHTAQVTLTPEIEGAMAEIA